MNRLICLIVLLAASHFAGAQQVAYVSEKDFLGEMPIVLSVSRLPQRLDETPGAVTILDRRTIRLTGARDVADLLRLVPGFRVSNSFESNTPQGSYHGSWGDYSNHIQVMVDGRSVYSPFLQGSTGPGLQTVAIDDIERIEVLRGSNSAAYGARAFLGIINIVTRDTVDTQGVSAHIATGENGIQDALVRLGWGDDRGTFRLGADRRADNGLSGASGPDRVGRFNFRADLHPGGGNQIELRAGQSVIDAGVGFAAQDGNAPRTRSIDISFLQLDWRRNLGPDEDLALQASHTHELDRDIFPYVPIMGLMIDTGGQATNDNLSLQHTLRMRADLRLVWGGELRREAVVSRPLFDSDATFTTDFTRLFTNMEWRLRPDWVLNAGGMFERSNLSGDHLSPRVMLNWHVIEGQTLRYGVSRAYRPPSTFEKFGNIRYRDPSSGTLLGVTTVARGGVQAEGVLSREIGYLGEFPDLGLSLDVRGFQEEVRDFIRMSNYPLSYGLRCPASEPACATDYINGENFNIHGIEYQIRWQPWRGGQVLFSESRVDSGWTDNGTFNARPFSSSSLMFVQQLPAGLDFSLMYYQSDSTNFPGTASPLAPAMSRTDLRLAKQFRAGTQRGEISFVLQNMGAAYQDFLPDFYFRRQAYVMLRLDN